MYFNPRPGISHLEEPLCLTCAHGSPACRRTGERSRGCDCSPRPNARRAGSLSECASESVADQHEPGVGFGPGQHRLTIPAVAMVETVCGNLIDVSGGGLK